MNINLKNEIEKITNPIQGWLTTNEGELLYDLAEQSNGLIVELGSWKGKSSIWLAKGCKNFITCIDHFEGDDGTLKKFGKTNTFSEFLQNIEKCNVKNKIQIIIADTKSAVNGFKNNSISLLYIDTAHDYKNVKEEYNQWIDKIKDDGIIVFHDVFGIDKNESNWPDVQKVFFEIIGSKIYNRVDRIGYFIKQNIYK